MENEIMKANMATEVAAPVEAPCGFEDTDSSDIVIPRIKVINALSPERQEGAAEEGDVLNSLTKEKVNGKVFIPIKQYYSKIHWNPDRDADPRIMCMSRDGKIGQTSDGGKALCDSCTKCRFDNTKTGKDAQPQCTSYLNFLGFFAGDPMPVVLSFAKTNYNEGKKMISLAKAMRQDIWAYGYIVDSAKQTKGRNTWFNIKVTMGNATATEDVMLARELYNAYKSMDLSVDYEDVATLSNDVPPVDANVAAEI